MLYMLELHYEREHRAEALDYFWKHGATRYEAKVTLKGAWVATHELVAYALVHAADEAEIAKACAPLEKFGKVIHRQVTSADQL